MGNERIELLQRMPVFGGVSHKTLVYLENHAHIVSVRQGEFFFGEGALADAVFVLDEGQALVLKSWHGDIYRLNSLLVGDCFGEMAIIEMSPRSAAVKAVEDCRAIKISTGVLYDVYEQQSDQYLLILMNMAREISRRLRLADERSFLAHAVKEGSDVYSEEHYLI